MKYIIRNAKKEEARDLAFLVNLAGKSDRCQGLNLYEWKMDTKDGEDPYDVAVKDIAKDNGQYSYTNMRVIEAEGKIAAVAMSYEVSRYSREEIEKMPELFHVFKKLTNNIAGGFYLDSLAASPDFRGMGFGRMMLEDTIEQARSRGYDAIYLIAFNENIPAVTLYKNNDFYPIHDLPTPDHPEMPFGGRTVLFKKDL